MVLISRVLLEGGLHVGSSHGRTDSVANFVFIYLYFSRENRLLAKRFNEHTFTDHDAPKDRSKIKTSCFEELEASSHYF